MKRVISRAPIENCCQLIIAPGEFVTDNMLPAVAKVARPLTTTGPTGLAETMAPGQNAKQAATAIVSSFGLKVCLCLRVARLFKYAGLAGFRGRYINRKFR